MSVLAHDVDQRQRGLNLRSLLFVPADRPERFAKAASSGADALILDLEDFVAPAKKEVGRTSINDLTDTDLAPCCLGVLTGSLPKAEAAPSVTALIDKIGDAPGCSNIADCFRDACGGLSTQQLWRGPAAFCWSDLGC